MRYKELNDLIDSGEVKIGSLFEYDNNNIIFKLIKFVGNKPYSTVRVRGYATFDSKYLHIMNSAYTLDIASIRLIKFE